MTYAIREIADLAGVTTRTLRYYDEIGLLPPARTGENGYRYYNQASLVKLQQILFFREMEVPLNEIHQIMNRPDFSLLGALEEHRSSLLKKSERLSKLINTIDLTIATIKGESNMSAKEYFKGFDETQYEEEARQRWGETRQYAESQKKWASYSKAQKEAIKSEGEHLFVRMVREDPNTAPDDPHVQAAIGEYFAYINKNFYTCEVGHLRGLADLWVEDPRFTNNFEKIREGGADFVREAVQIFCDRNG
jgi:DNA-binding transcriptional MerR regulator